MRVAAGLSENFGDADVVFQIKASMKTHTGADFAIGLRALPQQARRNWHGAWGDKYDARLHLDAWRRVLDKEEPDYAM